MQSLVLILIGLSGSGKSTASNFFKSRNITVFRMGDLSYRELKKKKLSINFENEKYIKEELRRVYGKKVYAQRVIECIKKLEIKSKVVVIEGMRSQDELIAFQLTFNRIKVIFIDSNKRNRYKRLAKRQDRPLNYKQAQERDNYEVQTFSLDGLKFKADYTVTNDGDIEEFYQKLENIFKINLK